MPGAMESKGDGEYPYSAPFTGLNLSVPSILLPPTAQDLQTSPSFAIVRGSIAAPWPYGTTLFGSSLGAGEYFLFATATGYVVTNLGIYQLQPTATPATAWTLAALVAMPAGAFPAQGNGNPVPFIETNGCLYFSCQLGIYRYSPINGLTAWSIVLAANFMTIFNQRLVVVGTVATTETTIPGTPSGTPSGSGGTIPAGTYYAVVTAVFPSGTEGPASTESAGVVTTGSTSSIDWTWAAVPGATSYNLYIGSATGEENTVTNVTGTTYTQTSYATGTVSPPVFPPIGPYTIAWSAVSDFSYTSVGSFNSSPNTNAGVVGGFDVLTNYSQGFPTGIINLGHSIYIQMTQGIVEVDPAASGTAPYTIYNYWQEQVPVGAIPGSVAQFGPIAVFITPDNVNVWVPGAQTQIGGAIMPYLRSILRNAALQEIPGNAYPLLQNPPMNSTFYTMYNELHYCLTFNLFGVPPQQAAPPYPNQATEPVWFGLILDYNFQTTAWTQQVTPPLTGEIYQVNGPPLTASTYSAIPTQSIYICGTQPAPGEQAGWIIFAPDVFNQVVYAGAQCQGIESQPQPCKVGFPQSPISAGHRPAVRRVRIEYSMDELSCATETAPVNLTVSLQGTITQNTGATNSTGVATTTLQSISKTIQIQPPGAVATSGTIIPFLTATAYADMVISLENPQVSLSWTDPSAHQRLLIHRVTALVNDTKGVTQ